MFARIICFITLFCYVNTIAYDESCTYNVQNSTLTSGITLVETILEDIFDLEEQQETVIPDYCFYDDYRSVSINPFILPQLFSFMIYVLHNNSIEPIHHFEEKNNSIPLQLGYYRYISLLKPS